MTEKKEPVSLSELNLRIRETIRNAFPEQYRVIAEIHEMNINRSGHCYLELIEKDPVNDRIIARARGTIWARTFRMLKPYFETTTGYDFGAGIKVMLIVRPEFHELYGFSLNITDIDPTYTLGDQQRKKLEIIRRLEKEGVVNMNKELGMPFIPQTIAVISSATAAGYQDFMNQLMNNPCGYKFYPCLFHAMMQGDRAEQSVIKALDRIFEWADFFDVVVIIRGGGSKTDLSCFDTYGIAFHIAQFPLPVITGIGHEKDESIADMIAHTAVKTPTAAAEFLIDRAFGFERDLNGLFDRLAGKVNQVLHRENNLVSMRIQRFISSSRNALRSHDAMLGRLSARTGKSAKHLLNGEMQKISSHPGRLLSAARHSFRIGRIELENKIKKLESQSRYRIEKEQSKLQMMDKIARQMDPEKILKLGYSITTSKGKLIRDSGMLARGDGIHTRYYKGGTESKVEKIIPPGK